jgi:hypothetical protein
VDYEGSWLSSEKSDKNLNKRQHVPLNTIFGNQESKLKLEKIDLAFSLHI